MILFFDTDAPVQAFEKKHPFKGEKVEFFKTNLNRTPKKKLEPFLNETTVISLFVHSESINNAKLDLFPNLKLIATRSTGFNHIDLDYCRARGIKVATVPRYGETTVAEYTFGLLLDVCRKICLAHQDMRQNTIRMNDYVGFDLFGKTLGVIGTGSIGSHVIKIARGFGMNVLAFDKFQKPEFKDIYVKKLSDLYKKSDIITLHVPSTPENHHLLDEKAFDQMKRGVLLVNTSRGDLIDTDALYNAIKSGKLYGAGLDVLEHEDFLLHDEIDIKTESKNPDYLLDSALNMKLLQFKNVLATPHIAFNSVDAIERIIQTTHDNIQSFLNGNPTNCVD